MNWLLTGGCGFIGRNLIRVLTQKEGNYIRVVDNLSTGRKEDLADICTFSECSAISHPKLGKVDFHQLDILDEKAATKVAENIDVIVHLAANTGVSPSVENPRYDCLNNVVGTLNYLEAARRNMVKRFVFASSGAPAGECEPPIHEELPPHPVSPYGASKLAGEGYCSAYYRTYSIETVALRFSNVYGPLSTRKDSVVAKFIKQILGGHELEIYGDGAQSRDFIYIDDLIKAILLSAVKPQVGGETFQIAASNETTVGELLKLVKDLFKERKWHREINVRYTEPRIGDVKRNFSDTSKALSLLGWKAETEIEVGLNKTIDWFLKQEAEQLYPTV